MLTEIRCNVIGWCRHDSVNGLKELRRITDNTGLFEPGEMTTAFWVSPLNGIRRATVQQLEKDTNADAKD